MSEKTTLARAVVVLTALVAFGCKDSGEPGEDAGLDGAEDTSVVMEDAQLEDTTPPPPPVPQPPALRFRDRDLRAGFATGEVVLVHAEDERALDAYVLAYADAQGVASAPIATWPKLTETLTHTFTQTALPPSATHLVAYSQGAMGDSARVQVLLDNFVWHHGLEGEGEDGYHDLNATKLLPIAGSDKVLAVGIDPAGRISIRRCAADGASCAELRAIPGALDGNRIAATVTASALYVVAPRLGRADVYVCPVPTDTAPLGNCNGYALPGVFRDPAVAANASRLYIATVSGTGVATLTCPLAGPNEGTPCTRIEHAFALESRLRMFATSSRLYVSGYSGLFDCAFDGSARPTGCMARTIAPFAGDLAVSSKAVYVSHYTGSPKLTVCPTGAGGEITACAAPAAQPASGDTLLVQGDALYAVGHPSFSSTSYIDRCPLDAQGQPTACVSQTLEAGNVIRPMSSLVHGGDLFAMDRGHLLHCDLEASGAPVSCARNVVPAPPLGFDGEVSGIDSNDALVVVRTRTLARGRTAVHVCPRNADGSLGACVVSQLPETVSERETPGIALRGRTVYLGRRGTGARAAINRCAIEESLALGTCTETVFEEDDASFYGAGLSFDVTESTFALASLVDGGGMRMFRCVLDATGGFVQPCNASLVEESAYWVAGSNVVVHGQTAYASAVTSTGSWVSACPIAGGACTVAGLPAYQVETPEAAAVTIDGSRLYVSNAPAEGSGEDLAMGIAVIACDLVNGIPQACAPHVVDTPRGRRGGRLVADGGFLYFGLVDGSTREPVILRCDATSGPPTDCDGITMSADQGMDSAGYSGFFGGTWRQRLFVTRAPDGAIFMATENPKRRYRASIFSVRVH